MDLDSTHVTRHVRTIYRPQEILEMQGLPLLKDSLDAVGLETPPFNPDVISPAAQRRLAGNSFNQACFSAWLIFILGNLAKRDHAASSSGIHKTDPTKTDCDEESLGSESCEPGICADDID